MSAGNARRILPAFATAARCELIAITRCASAATAPKWIAPGPNVSAKSGPRRHSKWTWHDRWNARLRAIFSRAR